MNVQSLSPSNSVSYRYKNMTKREKLLDMVTKQLKKIWHKRNIDDPIREMLLWYNSETNGNYQSLNELDEITLEWMTHMLIQDVFSLCEIVKSKTQRVLELH